jgi:hypothetical protein
VASYLQKYFIKYKQNDNFLDFNVYRVGSDYFVKATFANYNYSLDINEGSGRVERP